MDILIIDDHHLFIDGLEHVLQQSFSPLTISKTHDGHSTLQLLDESQCFDLILLDLNLPDLNGLGLLKAIQSRKLLIPVVIISAEDELRVIKHAINAGALGFIPKAHNSSELIAALHTVLSGKIYLPEHIGKQFYGANDLTKKNKLAKSHGLTARHLDILDLLAKGHSNQDIADKLFLTLNTVKTHIQKIFRLLEVKNRHACVRHAENIGLINAVAD